MLPWWYEKEWNISGVRILVGQDGLMWINKQNYILPKYTGAVPGSNHLTCAVARARTHDLPIFSLVLKPLNSNMMLIQKVQSSFPFLGGR